jgi:hypothetical protein
MNQNALPARFDVADNGPRQWRRDLLAEGHL